MISNDQSQQSDYTHWPIAWAQLRRPANPNAATTNIDQSQRSSGGNRPITDLLNGELAVDEPITDERLTALAARLSADLGDNRRGR